MIKGEDMNKKAFTLSEILITIGIIAIVAALTMPALIANHQKKVVAVRLEKFYSVFNQALFMSVIDNGDMSTWTFPVSYYDWEGSCTFFNTYLKKYMQYIDLKCKQIQTVWPTFGVEITLSDGSAFNIAGEWVTFYPVSGRRKYVNRDIFLFIMLKDSNKLYPYGYARKRDEILKNSHHDMNCMKKSVDINTAEEKSRACASVIMQDGWEISEDYPW